MKILKRNKAPSQETAEPIKRKSYHLLSVQVLHERLRDKLKEGEPYFGDNASKVKKAARMALDGSEHFTADRKEFERLKETEPVLSAVRRLGETASEQGIGNNAHTDTPIVIPYPEGGDQVGEIRLRFRPSYPGVQVGFSGEDHCYSVTAEQISRQLTGMEEKDGPRDALDAEGRQQLVERLNGVSGALEAAAHLESLL